MNIVVLDDVTINEEQIERLKKLGNLVVHTGSPNSDAEIIERAKGADIILNGWSYLNKTVLEALPDLKFISLWSTGYDHVDLDVASDQDIRVSNVRGYAKNAVAEMAVGLMLAVMRKIPQADTDVRASQAYRWDLFGGSELTGKTIGILGTGAIGQKVARIAYGFEMKIVAYDPYPNEVLHNKFGVQYVSLDEVVEQSDVLTLHLPLIESTQNLISKTKLKKLKPSAVVINTARAEIIDQDALCASLKSGEIAGAGLDDIHLKSESGLELLELDNVVLTPHIGFNTKEATLVKTDGCIDNVESFINGNPQNVLNES